MPRGKTLGGSSSINAMVYIRGARADYDGWRDLGNPGWGYDDVLPYFKRSEDNERGESEYHGVGGPLTVSESRSNNPMADAWVEAAVAAGPRAERRLQRRRPGRRRALPGDPARRHALLDGRRLPASRRRAAEPDGRDAHARAPRAARRHARRRRGGRAGRRARRGPRRARGAALRGRVQLAAAAAALGHRPRRGARARARSTSCSTCRASGATSRTTCRSAASGPPRSRSR